MFTLVKGFFSNTFQNFPKSKSSIISEIDNSTETQINNLIDNIPDEDLEKVIIEVRAKKSLIKTKPAYDNEVVSTSKQILTFGGAGLAFTLAFYDKIKSLPVQLLSVFTFVGYFYINLIIASLFILLLFLLQSRFRYPFLFFQKIGNTVPYFYYRSISHNIPRNIFQTFEQKESSMRLYASDLLKFAEYVIDIKTENRNDFSKKEFKRLKERQILKDEIQQYFLLLSYQGYTNQFEVILSNNFIICLIGSLIAAFIITIAHH